MKEPTYEPERAWVDTGFQQHVAASVNRIPEFDRRTGAHLWTVIQMHRVVPAMWADPTATPHLDMENLLTVQGPVCFFCEELYSDRLDKRRCKGKP